MQLLTDNLTSTRPTAIAIGKFDGIHIGHRYLLEKMLLTAKEDGLVPSILTFSPHPEKFYGSSMPLITTRVQKMTLLSKAGAELCFEVHFDELFSAVSAEDFMSHYLVEKLNAKAIVVGDDFHFGYKRRGDTSLLRAFCEDRGIILKVIPRLTMNAVTISSSGVRANVTGGDLETAASFLGREYSCIGNVVEGDKMGSKIGFPTANIALESELVPPDGVYAASLQIDNQSYKAMLYIGSRPTVDGQDRRFELNILDYEGDLYGRNVEVFIRKKVRDDMKFAGIDELVTQINEDRRVITLI